MVGDWVQDKNLQEAKYKVEAIGYSSITIKMGDELQDYDISKFEPVLLTDGILNKNIEDCGGLGWYDVYIFRIDEYDAEYNWPSKFFGISDAFRYPKKPRFALVQNDHENVVLDDIKYVHELQHILRLFGIDKEVVL